MEFSSLSRRELQALCKRNKIPANLTNVAMVDSLIAQDTVEGIDEILQACKSEKVQSSIEPPSPYVTPAPLGVASRRRRAAKGDSAATQVGGTRRSARLAEKSARLSKGVGNGNTDHSNKDLFIAGGQEVKINFEESLDSLGEMSGVTYMEDNCEKKDEGQVDLADKQNVFTDVQPAQAIEEVTEKSLGEMSGVTDMEENCEKKDEGQVDSADKQNVFTDVQLVQAIEEVTEKSVELLEQTDDEISDFLKKDLSNDDGLVVLKESPDGSEVENSVEKDESEVEKESLSDTVDQQIYTPDMATELNETSDAEIDLESSGSDIDVEYGNEGCDDADEFVTDDDADSSETESGSDKSDSITLDLTEESKSTKNKDSTDCMASEISSMSYEDLAIESESDVTTTDQVSYTDALLSEEARDQLNESPTHQVAAPSPKNIITTPIAIKEVPLIFTGSNDSSFVTQPNISTPKGASVSKVYERRARMAAASDNKENVGSGSKTAPAKMRSKFIKEIADTAPMLDDNNLKKLAEDMKELHITQKSDKNEGASEVSVRTALKVLPENRNVE